MSSAALPAVLSAVPGAVLAVVQALLLSASATEAPDLSWLEGRWSGEQEGVTSTEQWLAPAPGVLLGVHSDVEGVRLVSWEFLRIETIADGTFYFASPRSAPPTAFELVEVGERRAVFENKRHDFPQRILYWLDAAGALHARIEGPRGEGTASMDWVWTRVR